MISYINKAVIKDMYEVGFPIKKISLKLNIKFEYIKQYIIQENIQLKYEKFDNTKIQEIVQYYNLGIGLKTLGKRYGVNTNRFSKHIDNLRLDSNRMIEFNYNIFDEINTKHKAYWLGFMYADAYNSNRFLRIGLADKDRDHIEKFCDFIGYPKELIATDKKNISTVCIYSKHLCDVLTGLGCHKAKSFTIKYPEFLSEEFNSHFIRGVFDGDGSLYSCKKDRVDYVISIAGTKELLERISDMISQKTGIISKIKYISKTENNTYEIKVLGNKRVQKVMSYIYFDSESDIRMQRKFDKNIILNEFLKQKRHE